MPRRRSIEIEGVQHGAPIPMGSRIDNIVYSSAILGIDPETGELADDPARQVRLAFGNLIKFLEAAEITAEDIIKMTVFVKDMAVREYVNEEWLKLFPNPESRPARHVIESPLNNSMLLQLELVAVAES